MFSEELSKRIMKIYKDDSEIAKKLLEGDRNTIQQMKYQFQFTEDMIIYAYEHGKMEELYNEAKRQVEINNLYHDLCKALAELSINEKNK